MTALHQSVRNRHKECCELLIANKANVDARARDDESTPLHLASKKGHSQVAHVLLSHSPNASITDKAEYLSIHRSARGGHTEVITILLSEAIRRLLSDVSKYLDKLYTCRAELSFYARMMLA